MTKTFGIPADAIKPLAPGRGACHASDRITVDRGRVGWMYRETPTVAGDSGWRFFAGTEDQAYADNPANFSIYDVNTIANYDPEIIELLDAPVGSTFVRDRLSGRLRPDTPWEVSQDSSR